MNQKQKCVTRGDGECVSADHCIHDYPAASGAILAFAAWLVREYDELQREHFVDAAEEYLRSNPPPPKRVNRDIEEALNSGNGTYKP